MSEKKISKNLRLDLFLAVRGMVNSRHQAESYIKLGQVLVNGQVTKKSAYKVKPTDKIELLAEEKYVSRAGMKLASVAKELDIEFLNKLVLDVGSSTGGFTQYSLEKGAKKVIAVDVGTKQMHPSLINHPKILLKEQTDIRDINSFKEKIDIVLIDVSFISIRDILLHLQKLINNDAYVVAMVKPQFEVGDQLKHRGVIKNDALRRKILKEFEAWVKNKYKIINKTDSKIAGAKGNVERFYLLKSIQSKS